MSERPDIVWIVADHQVHATRPSAPGLYCLQDRLARTGVEFTRARTVLPICSPARASMLTGLYPHSHGVTENDGRFGGRPGLHPSDWMIHEPLREAGYRCAWFGKWHVDNERPPADYGFEGDAPAGYGYPYTRSAYREYLARHDLPEPIAKVVVPGESAMLEGTELALSSSAKWFDDESGVLHLRDSARVHEAFFVADIVRRWFESTHDAPRFLRIDAWGPHPPYLLGKPFAGRLDGADVALPGNFTSDLGHRPAHHRRYRDSWQEVHGSDPAVWRALYQAALEHASLVEAALDEFIATLDPERTLIVFTADHGDAVGSNGGVANKGALMVEATMRVPLLVAGPGIRGGHQRDALVGNIDIGPTLLECCGLDTPASLHGCSLVPLLDNPDAPFRTGFMAEHYGLHEPIEQRAWYEEDWKLVIQADGECELYDLAADPDELSNCAREPAFAGVRRDLARNLVRAMDSLGDTSEIAHLVYSTPR